MTAPTNGLCPVCAGTGSIARLDWANHRIEIEACPHCQPAKPKGPPDDPL